MSPSRPRLAALLMACAVAACADAPAPSTGVTPPAGTVTMPDLQVAMRDGVRLNTTVWLPSTGGRFPVVLIRTPYRTEVEFGASSLAGELLQAGYAVVQQHERGRYLSEGRMRMLGQADEDGWDTLDWIARQPWSYARVATYGCSSSAENQLKLASLGHPAHRAMIVGSSGVGIAAIGPHREQGNFWRGGAWQMGWADYFFDAMYLDWPQLPAGLSDAERTARMATAQVPERPPIAKEALSRARMHLPMIDLAEAAGAPDTELEEYLQRGPHHPAWAEDRVTDADVIRVPGLWAEATYDISAASGAAFFEKTRRENPAGTQALVITNGGHCSFGGSPTKIGDRPIGGEPLAWRTQVLAWLDRWLKEDPTAPRLPAVQAHLAGADRWATFAGVPTADGTAGRTLYLSSGGNANTAAGDGVLLWSPPASAVRDSYTYDPADPVITLGGQIGGLGTDQKDGAFDQRVSSSRKDVLVYTTAPLAEDVAVFGFVTVDLTVASDAPDTDFTVKLVSVGPDGVAWNISDTIQRMRYRQGEDEVVFMEPGETYSISPPPMLVSNVFPKGHRIRVEVSSSNFPAYARNLNTTDDPYTSTAVRVARNGVLHGPGRLARIRLPEVPR
ncbi:MAG: CocE/NonD family hydrolase [Gammaproteobacteria bacterium]